MSATLLLPTLDLVVKELEAAVEPQVEETANSAVDRQEWRNRARELARSSSKLQWQIGDLLCEGEDKWDREIYKDAAAIFTEYARDTLYGFASVARSVETLSRNKDLSWAHHKAVMGLPQEKQREMLARAANEGMSVSAFRKFINEECSTLDDSEPGDKPKFIKLTLKVPSDLFEELLRASSEKGDEVEGTILFLVQVALKLPDIWERLGNLHEGGE